MAFDASNQRTGAMQATATARLLMPVTAATLFISAFLLFSVQPFFAKMVLPIFGGTPAVWSVAMVFFQAALLAGYAYAHGLTRLLPLRLAILAHLCLLAITILALPIAIPAGWQTPPAESSGLWLIGLFTVSVGLPFFAVSANGPLLQAWFAQSGHEHAKDPYFLYGASNIGSFASLILYVIAIEPMLDLSAQSRAWSAGFMVLVGCIALTGWLVIRHAAIAGVPVEKIEREVAPAVTGRGREWVTWVALAFLPSALLVAVTAHVSTDIAAIPLLWIVPLALFLLTFVLAFRSTPVVPLRLMHGVVLATVLPLLFIAVRGISPPSWASLPLNFMAFFAVAMLAHMMLAERRPAADRLTEFYFALSVGGVIGGLFAGLLAPNIFSWIAEYPLLLIASLLLIPRFWSPLSRKGFAWLALAILGAAGLSAVLQVVGKVQAFAVAETTAAINIVLGLAAVYFAWRTPRLVPVLALTMVGNMAYNIQAGSGHAPERSFFGVLRVVDSTEPKVRAFYHGTTLHGAMRISDTEGTSRPSPLTYYTADGGIGRAIEAARQTAGGTLGRFGIIGVGLGSLACQAKPGEAMDLIEIDPAVMRIAKDASKFRFLSACAQGASEFIGDGRLVVAGLEPARYDALIVDAFSSNSIPVHLMTSEAMQMMISRIKPEGMLILHISNRHMELQSVVAANAAATGLHVRSGVFHPAKTAENLGTASASIVAVLARSPAVFARLDSDWRIPSAGTVRPWTDGYSNVLAAIWRGRGR